MRLMITQNDVRAIQLAKAALRAGIELLGRHAGVSELHDIRLAGAFGSHIDPVYALVLGLVPDCPVEHVRSVGNAAGAGAVRALLSVAARREMEAAVRNVVKVETATEPEFQAEFVAAMSFPHATASTPHLVHRRRPCPSAPGPTVGGRPPSEGAPMTAPGAAPDTEERMALATRPVWGCAETAAAAAVAAPAAAPPRAMQPT